MRKSFLVRVPLALLIVATLTCSPPSAGQRRGPLVLMISGRLVKEGSFEDCVAQEVQGGKKIEDAIKDCATLMPPDLSGTGLDALDLMPGSDGVRLSDCYGDWNSNAPVEHSSEFTSAQQWYMMYLTAGAQLASFDLQKRADFEKAQMQKVRAQAYAQYQKAKGGLTDEEKAELEFWADEMWGPDSEPSEPGDYVPPGGNTGVARPTRESESLCQQVSEFVGECNRDGWNNPQCKAFLDKLNGCLDPEVADPAEPGTESCKVPPVDPEKAREVAMLHCWGRRKPVPGEDPCTNTIHGMAFDYFIRTGGKLDPCNDPHVRETGEDCYPTFTLVKFEEVDLRELAKWGLDKLGGPVFVIPIGPPDDDGTTPLPKRPDDH